MSDNGRLLSYRDYYQMHSEEFQPGDIIEVRAVLTIGYGNDYTLYVAPEGNWPPHQIAARGDKIALGGDAAKALFPTAAHGRYYRR